MGILLAFTPSVLFAVIDRWVGVASGLAAGTALSAALVLRDWLWRRRGVKLLELGTLLLFGGLTLVAVLLQPDWPLMAVRLSLDSGLLLIALVSLAIGRPFTLQYAREQVPPAFWASPLFLRANQVITAVWAACFLVTVAADLLLRPRLAADATGVQVRTLAVRRRLPWSALRVDVDERSRYGLVSRALELEAGDTLERDGFAFADVVPRPLSAGAARAPASAARRRLR